MAVITEAELAENALFQPWAVKRIARLVRNDIPLVHYTSAAAALSILNNKEIWMRNARLMNDEKEVRHGWECWMSAYRSEAGLALRRFTASIFGPLIEQQIQRHFIDELEDLLNETYVTCFSEHRKSEDQYGRLSMWRGYATGGGHGVAVVLNTTAFRSTSSALQAFSSPVAYFEPRQFQAEFEYFVDGLLAASEWLKQLGPVEFYKRLFGAFWFAITCTKHPGFREEREWRVVTYRRFEPSKHVVADQIERDGKLQTVLKLPLKDIPDEGFTGAALPELLRRVIIGPVQDGEVVRKAIVEKLSFEGVIEASKKVVLSNLPYRAK